jgi:hypothetical protein
LWQRSWQLAAYAYQLFLVVAKASSSFFSFKKKKKKKKSALFMADVAPITYFYIYPSITHATM